MNAATAAEAPIPLRRILAFVAMVFGMFMAILDIQIVSASLSEIQAGLAASAEEITWVQTAYLIAEVVMIPLSGYLSRALSTRVFFSVCALGFTIASVLCAQATSLSEMVLWRAVQGFLGGGLIPGVFAASFTIFPASKRHIVQPIMGLIATLAPTIGPTIGGMLSHAFSWHWLFLINLVPGALVAVASWLLIDFDEPEHGLLGKFDWIGLFAMAAFLGSIEFVLDEGPRRDWFDDEHIRVFAGVAILGGIVFFWRILTRPVPLVDLAPFRDRNFAIGSLMTFAMGVGLFGLTYLYPVYLSRVRNLDSLLIGETMFVTGLCQFCTAPVAGWFTRRVDPRLTMAIGLAGFGYGTWLASGMTRDWDFNELVWPQVFRGISLMLAMVAINNVSMGSLPPAMMKGAAGIYNLTRQLGGAFGLALINTALSERSDLHFRRLSEGIGATRSRAEEFLAQLTERFAEFGDQAGLMALKRLDAILHREALVMAFADIFLVMTLVVWALVFGSIFVRARAGALR